MYAQESIDMLVKAGIDFNKHEDEGIDPLYFGELLITSGTCDLLFSAQCAGLVLTDDVKWISFHSYYDFGYLLKLLTCRAMPPEENEFFDILRTYFPCIYDVKYLMRSCEHLRGGLSKLAEMLEVCLRFSSSWL